MKGLELARRYYEERVRPAFAERAPEVLDRTAFGLAGAGSECLGFDDEVSRDHDWGPRVCIWIPDDVFGSRGDELQVIYDDLRGPFLGYPPPKRIDDVRRRDGVMAVDGFYRGYLGTSRAPESLRDWILMPEEALAACTSGEVFADPEGRFSELRAAFSAYFPRDLRLKKIALRCRSAGRHGQYDIWRAHARRDESAIRYHAAGFSYDVAALAHLAARKYRPYGKWIFRSLLTLGNPGAALHTALLRFGDGTGNARERSRAAEECAGLILNELDRQDMGGRSGISLFDRGDDVESMIGDAGLRDGLASMNQAGRERLQ